MTVIDRGAKHRCPDCDIPFYDLNRASAMCPKCGVEVKAPAPKLPRAKMPKRKSTNWRL